MPVRIRRWRAHQFVAEPESAVRIARRAGAGQLVEDALRVDRVRALVARASSRIRHQRVDARLDLLAPRAVLLALEQRDQRPQRLARRRRRG